MDTLVRVLGGLAIAFVVVKALPVAFLIGVLMLIPPERTYRRINNDEFFTPRSKRGY